MKKKILFIIFLLNITAVFSGEIELRQKIERIYAEEKLTELVAAGKNYIKTYPDSVFSSNVNYWTAKLYMKKGDTKNATGYFELALETGKADETVYEEIIYNLYILKKEAVPQEAVAYIDTLVKLNKEKYKVERGRFYVKYISESYGMDIIKEAFNEGILPDAAIAIGDYYFEKADYRNAVNYYTGNDHIKTINAYISLKEIKGADDYLKALSEAEKQKATFVLKEFKSKYDEIDKVRRYYESADKNMADGKPDLAKLFYKKIIDEASDSKLKEQAYLQLGKITFEAKKYDETLNYIGKYIEYNNIKNNAEALYYLAYIYYTKNETQKASFYFDRIAKEYPFTYWETKSKIYILKLKK